MNNLIIEALLGDEESQKQCTEKGIILPCPCCSGKADCWEDSYLHKGYVQCEDCDLIIEDSSKEKAILFWNKRPVPPIGRCKTCKHFYPDCTTTHGYMICPETGMEVTEKDFCSSFKPRENNR